MRLPWCLPSAVGLACLLVAPALSAQTFLYGMSETGRLLLNGTVLDKLPGGFDPLDTTDPNVTERWADFELRGSDRYTLRVDGRMQKNGKKLMQLPWLLGIAAWFEHEPEGDTVWALRADGLLHLDKMKRSDFITQGHPFVDLEVVAGVAVALRRDGALFIDGEEEIPAVEFKAGHSVDGGNDGQLGSMAPLASAYWVDLELIESFGSLWAFALRRDGRMHRAELPAPGYSEPIESEVVSHLPFPDDDMAQPPLFSAADLYVDVEPIEMPLDGGLETMDVVTLRQDGRLLHVGPIGLILLEDPPFVERVDYEGDGVIEEQHFQELAVLGESYGAVRLDGKLFLDDDIDAVLDMSKSGFTRLAITDTPPDLTHFKNNRPEVARYKARAVEGTPFTVPILAWDVDLASEDLVITLAEGQELPPGVAFDGMTREITLDGTQPKGKVAVKIEVDDGVLKKPRKFKFAVKVMPADTNPDKNKKPGLAKIGKLQALVGIELAVKLLPFDADGDEVTIEAVMEQGIFALPESDAAYDDGTRTLTWTATLEDLGKQQARFRVSDGDATRKVKVGLKVVSPLIF